MYTRIIKAALTLIVFSACGSKTSPGAADSTQAVVAADIISLNDAQFKNAEITTGPVDAKSVNRVLKVNGTIEAHTENRQTISFPLGGYIKTNNLVPGMQVSKGALLATMEDASFIQLQQDYLLNKSKLTYLEADYNRQQELSKTQSNSQRTFQQAKADFESARVTDRALAEKLRLLGLQPEKLNENNITRTVNIYAPMSGYISKVNVNPGKYVAPTDELFEMVDPSKVHVSLTVFENDAAALKKGQQVLCTVTGHSGPLPATIELVTPDLNESRAVEVHCHFDKPVKGLLPGAFVAAQIVLANQQGYSLPDDAVVKAQDHYYIFLEQKPRTYKIMEVQTGNSLNGATEILTPLPANTNVVTANAYTLYTMMKNTGE